MYSVVTPWPPQRNGIADYAFEVTRHASEPVVVATRAISPLQCGPNVLILDDELFRNSVSPGAVPAIYHFGNNPDHAFMVPLFLRNPGIAVVHEVSLHYLAEKVDAVLPGFFDEQLRAEHPRIAEGLRAVWRAEGMKRALDFREIALLGWLQPARAIIVHSHYAARIVAGYLPGQRLHVIPHFAYPANLSFAELGALRKHARARLGIDPEALLVSTLGFATRNKQYPVVFRALKQARSGARREILFLVAGELRPHEYDLEADLRECGAQGFTRLLGYVAEERMRDVLLASDLVVNLRFPSFGESSGSLARALGLGCGIVATDAGSYSELPDEACFKIPAKSDPSRELHELIARVLEHPGELERKQAAAYEYAHSVLAPRRAAERYSEIAHGA